MTLRILHVIPSVAPCRGGPSKAIVDMVAALKEQGVVTEIATTNDACEELMDVPLGKLVDYQGVPCRFFARFSPGLPGLRGLREFQYSSTFGEWLRNNIQRYDLLHVHAIFSYCSTYSMWLARKRGIPYIVRTIGQLQDWSMQQAAIKKKLYLAMLERTNLQNAACVQFTAKPEQDQALGLIPALTSEVIPLGINSDGQLAGAAEEIRETWSVPAGTPIIAWLSRIHPKKGLELLLQALAAQPQQEFRLLVAGTGPVEYVEKLKQLAQQLGLAPKISWLGFVQGSEKALLLQGADLFALTSYAENFGISVLEALAAGAPVLVTDQVALADLIAEQNIGYVCETNKDSISASLAEALQTIGQQPSLHQQMSDRSRNYISQNYRWTQVAARLDDLYRQCLTSAADQS